MAWPTPHGDSYRPRFDNDRAATHGDSYRPRFDPDRIPPRPPRDAQEAMYHFQGNQNSGARQDVPHRPPGGFNFRHPRPKISERPLLTSMHNSSEELTFPTLNLQDRFQFDDLSDADDSEMDISESEDDGQPSKRARFDSNNKSANIGSRWSNPDPYTSLPPPDESVRKRKDVVKLIRKARVTSGPTQGSAEDVARVEDFISLDFGGDDTEHHENPSSDSRRYSPPVDAPRGPRAKDKSVGVVEEGLGRITQTGASMLGKRKRDDKPREARLIQKRGKGYYQDGMILREWQAVEPINPTPWYRTDDHRALEPPGVS